MRDRFEWARARDYRDHMKTENQEYGIGEPHAEPAQLGDSVGAMMEVAIKLAGGNVVDRVGRTFCETDYLAIGNASFPADVPPEMLARFNAATLCLPDEIVGEVRYKLVAAFWHPETFEARLRAAVKRERREWENRRREEVT